MEDSKCPHGARWTTCGHQHPPKPQVSLEELLELAVDYWIAGRVSNAEACMRVAQSRVMVLAGDRDEDMD